MKKISTLFLFVLPVTIGLTFSGCKKYEDGPAISLNTKMHRAVNSWVIEQVFETSTNGTRTDRTGDYKTAYGNYNMILTKEEDYTITYSPYNVGNYSETGRWEFGGDKVNMLFFNDNGNNSSIGTLWRILRLKEKELWMKTVNGNGTTIEVHFMPK